MNEETTDQTAEAAPVETPPAETQEGATKDEGVEAGKDTPHGEVPGVYVGVDAKIFQAISMTDVEYDKHKGGNGDYSLAQEGYLLHYTDGYETWREKKSFEETYRLVSPEEIGLIK
jgi:hypothetical protein